MLLARSASTSTGRRNAGSEPQPEPLIRGLVPGQPAPGAVTDRVHKAIYCRQQAAEFSQPGGLTRGQGDDIRSWLRRFYAPRCYRFSTRQYAAVR